MVSTSESLAALGPCEVAILVHPAEAPDVLSIVIIQVESTVSSPTDIRPRPRLQSHPSNFFILVDCQPC
jgi:hypothetical protein